MTEGSLGKGIFFFSVPLILSNILQVLFNMADIAVAGRFAGAAALGAVGSTTTLVTLFTGFLMGLGAGVNVLVARFLGARMEGEVRRSVHTSAILCVAAGILIALLGVFGSRWLLELLHTKPELIDGAALYLRIYFLGMPAMAVYNFGNAVFSAAGNTKKPLLFLMAAGVLNVGLNLVFVIACQLSVAGVALASVISQYLTAVLILTALARETGCWGLCRRELRLSRDKARAVLYLGIPSGAQNAIFAVANLFIQTAVNSFDATMVAGNSAAANADALVYDVMAAFYTACASFISQNYGAGRIDRVKKSFFISMAYSFGAGAILGGALVLMGRPFLWLFTTEEAVVEAGMSRLTIMGVSYAVSAFMDCTIAAARGLGKSLAPTVIVILGSCVFRVVWVYTVFAWFRTVPSLYLLYVVSWTITAAAELAYFARCYRKLARGEVIPAG